MICPIQSDENNLKGKMLDRQTDGDLREVK